MLTKLGIALGAVTLGLAGAALAIAGTGSGTSGQSVEGQAFTVPVATYQSSFTGNQHFIYQLYEDLLGRAPSDSDLAYWTTALGNGTTRSQVAETLLHTDEYRGLLVDSIYQSFLKRDPSPAERATGVTLLGSSVSDELFKATILGSPEFFTTQGGGTVEGFLNALYEDVLGRPSIRRRWRPTKRRSLTAPPTRRSHTKC